MSPVEFDSANTTFADDQSEYIPLPAHIDSDGVVTTCWRATFRDRLLFLITGRMWLQFLTWGKPLHPSKMTSTRPALKDRE